MILDHVRLYGFDWLLETWKLVQEDKVQFLNDMVMLLPIARTPMDKKGAKSLQDYTKKVTRALGNRVPWSRASRGGGRLSHLRDKIPSGEVRVILGKGESEKGIKQNPLFTGVKTIRE